MLVTLTRVQKLLFTYMVSSKVIWHHFIVYQLDLKNTHTYKIIRYLPESFPFWVEELQL